MPFSAIILRLFLLRPSSLGMWRVAYYLLVFYIFRQTNKEIRIFEKNEILLYYFRPAFPGWGCIMYVYTYVLCVKTVFKACFVCRFRRRSPPDRLPGMDVTFNILPVTHLLPVSFSYFLFHPSFGVCCGRFLRQVVASPFIRLIRLIMYVQ